MGRRLTLKQERFIGEYLASEGNATEAARRAYNVDGSTARAMGAQNLAKVNVRAEIDRRLKKSGLTLERAFETVERNLDATIVTKEGKEVQNGPVQLKAADMTIRLHDAYPKSVGNQSKTEVIEEYERSKAFEQLRSQPLEHLILVYHTKQELTEAQRQYLAGDKKFLDECLKELRSTLKIPKDQAQSILDNAVNHILPNPQLNP